ncbi:MAG: hypothetical protein ACRDTO_00755 [Mycobacterium sp.]
MALIAALSGMSLTGWSAAGFFKFGSAAVSSGAITVPVYDELMIVARVVSLSAADIPALRFNADTGSNYRSRYIVQNATSGTTLTNVPTASTSVANLSGVSDAGARAITAVANNKTSLSKLGVVFGALGSGSASVQPKIDLAGHFEWVNTTAQMTSVELRSAGGSATFAIDSSVLILGRNFS